MSKLFTYNDPTIESQWRSLILFGKNSATYKFAFAKALFEIVNQQTTTIKIEELAKPFADNTIFHIKKIANKGYLKIVSFYKLVGTILRDI